MHAPFHNTALILLATVPQASQHRKDLHSDIKSGNVNTGNRDSY